jgi:DNA replication and repair protein RecF
VYLTELRIDCLRVIEHATLELSPQWTAFIGSNGAGKTSILEAVFMLSHGRTFRSGSRDTVSQLGSAGFSVFGRIGAADGVIRRLGLARVSGKLEARVDGESVGLGALVRASAVVCFEPGSHELINGGSEERRRYLDWGVFHVEHDFLQCWRRYQRALRQRNALLRETDDPNQFEPWEMEMADAGERLSAMRRQYIARLQPVLQETLSEFLVELGTPVLSFDAGWKETVSLADALREGRSRDRERGHTGRGPHRADWSIGFERAPRREHLSRGQEKLCALALILAQARLYAEQCGEWPILCLDDLASELDHAHQAQVIAVARASGAQVLVTGTELPGGLADDPAVSMFHVEQGRLRH